MMPMTSKSQTITNPDWLYNAHAGEMLLSEFMEPLDLTVEAMAELIAVSPDRIASVIDGDSPMDGELDLRLGRYFGMSEGFFLRLQDQYELLEAKRALNGALDRIVPRAA
jgi:addiction module HigA family antidote